jgi:hypothetical protein
LISRQTIMYQIIMLMEILPVSSNLDREKVELIVSIVTCMNPMYPKQMLDHSNLGQHFNIIMFYFHKITV